MSAEHHSVERPPSDDGRPPRARSGVELEFSADSRSDDRGDVSSADPEPAASNSGLVEPPLQYRIERTHLRARVAALERELEASERRRRSIVAQYERVLDDRTDSDSARASRADDAGLLERLFGRR